MERVVSFTPDHSGEYLAVFHTREKSWAEHIIGWAVVLVDEDSGDEQVQPVVLDGRHDDRDDGVPSTISEYRDVSGGNVGWGLRRVP
jgi:hypothetical protein